MNSTLAEQNKKLIETFYSAFQKKDGNTMASLYHPSARFEDAVFKLEGSKIGSMWKMLCLSGKDLQLQFSNVTADDKTGQARWIAEYTFAATGRKVTNHVLAQFVFQDGKIIKHTDTFSFWKWSSQALGPLGFLLGWTRAVQSKVQSMAGKNLDAFIKSNPT